MPVTRNTRDRKTPVVPASRRYLHEGDLYDRHHHRLDVAGFTSCEPPDRRRESESPRHASLRLSNLTPSKSTNTPLPTEYSTTPGLASARTMRHGFRYREPHESL
jgi:hypothetical protein